jgi:hypothetical protein
MATAPVRIVGEDVIVSAQSSPPIEPRDCCRLLLLPGAGSGPMSVASRRRHFSDQVVTNVFFLLPKIYQV